jgi:hypothetical protein
MLDSFWVYVEEQLHKSTESVGYSESAEAIYGNTKNKKGATKVTNHGSKTKITCVTPALCYRAGVSKSNSS